MVIVTGSKENFVEDIAIDGEGITDIVIKIDGDMQYVNVDIKYV